MIHPDDIRQAISVSDRGTILTIEVTARSRIDRFPAGYNPWRQAIGIHVKAPAVDGKANKAILALISDTLAISKSSIHILSGQTSSIKRLIIEEINQDSMLTILVPLISDS